jgi:hypothetical protein
MRWSPENVNTGPFEPSLGPFCPSRPLSSDLVCGAIPNPGTRTAMIKGGSMFHLQLFKTLSALASAGFNPRIYLLSIALGKTAADPRNQKRSSAV